MNLNTLPDTITVHDPTIVPMDVALEKAFEHFKMPRLGGASGRGWSSYRNLMACPRRFQLRYIIKARGEERAALGIGSCWHTFIALYYLNMKALIAGTDEGPAPSAMRDELLKQRADAVLVAEAWRLFEAYVDHWEGVGDYLEPLAVEHWVEDPRTKRTARYDLIARVTDEGKPRGIVPGLYIIEHKSLSSWGEKTANSYHLDGEIIGQLALWRKARPQLSRKFGKLQGIIINVVTKTKVPKLHREIVAPPMKVANAQWHDLDFWEATEAFYRAAGHWPKSLAACWDRYGPCDYVERCKTE